MFYKIEKDRYVAEADTAKTGWYESPARIDCTLYAPDETGAPVLIPVPEPPAPYVPTVAETAANQTARLKMSRNAAEAATPFFFDGSNFDYDPLSRERINAAISGATIAALSGMATNTVAAEWTLVDNLKRNMTIADWLAFRIAEISRSASCHSKYNAKKAEIAGYAGDEAMTADEAMAAILGVTWDGE